jgi:PTS system fructose-specific IIC component
VVPLIGNPFLCLVALAAGVCVSAASVIVLKGLRRQGALGADGSPGASGASAAVPQESVAA